MTECVNRVLIINLSRLGDFVSSFAVINAVKTSVERVDVICREAYKDIVLNEDNLNYISVENAQDIKYDALLDLTSVSETRGISRSINADIKVGSYSTWLKKIRYHLQGIYTISFKCKPNKNIVKDYFPYAELINIKGLPVPKLRKKVQPDIRRFYEIKESGPIIGVHISGTDETRRLPISLVRDIARYVNSIGGALVILGDRNRAEKIKVDMINVYFKEETIAELVSVVSQVDYLVAPDSGVLHLASALGVSALGVYGVNLVSEYGPPGKTIDFIEPDLDCRPCNYQDDCPFNIRCMYDLEISKVQSWIERKVVCKKSIYSSI